MRYRMLTSHRSGRSKASDDSYITDYAASSLYDRPRSASWPYGPTLSRRTVPAQASPDWTADCERLHGCRLARSPDPRARGTTRSSVGAGIKPGMIVAEVGAASGFMTMRLARLVSPGGMVYANDLQASMLQLLEQRASTQHVANIKFVQGPSSQSQTHLQPYRGQASSPLRCQRPVRLELAGLFLFALAIPKCGSGPDAGGFGPQPHPGSIEVFG